MSRDEQLLLKPGEEGTVGDYTLHLDAIRVTEDSQKQMVTAHITVKNAAGEVIDKMYPAKWFFWKKKDEPTTEVAIRRTFAEDLYIVMPGFELKEQTASVEVHINPLVNWLWFGFGVLAIGTLIALLPESAFSFALARLPAEAATATLLLLGVLLMPTSLFAQHVEAPRKGDWWYGRPRKSPSPTRWRAGAATSVRAVVARSFPSGRVPAGTARTSAMK